MSKLLSPIKWFYKEFGLSAIYETGRNAYLIILARSCRMLAHGAITVILALFFAALEFSDYQIGLFMTLTLLGDVLLGGFLTLIADRSGRRRVLLFGSALMLASGVVFATATNFWILLPAAVFGVISATGGDFGPFRSIEESMLSQLTTPRTRADVLAWYVTFSSVGSAAGSEAAGRIVHYLRGQGDWSVAGAYQVLFWGYSITGLINVVLTLSLTSACELGGGVEESYAQVPQQEVEVESAQIQNEHAASTPPPKPRWYQAGFLGRLSQISAPTRKIMYKLWILLALDSVADGMVPYSLTNYYIDTRFHPTSAALGDTTSAAYVLAAISTVFAGPLARKIGLVNTMVFTHIPSSAAVLIFPAAPNFVFAVLLLFVRSGLNNMDQAPRSAFIAGVVKPDERTAAMGITSMIRTLAAMAGPTLTGILAGNDKFWIAFVAAGACRLAYDVGLYVLFVNVKLHQHEGGGNAVVSPRMSEEEAGLELYELDSDKDDDTPTDKTESVTDSPRASGGGRLIPDAGSAVRKRSPSPLAKHKDGR